MTRLSPRQQVDPAEVALVALEMEQESASDYERNGMMFQRLVLPSTMDAMTRVIRKVGKAQAFASLPSYIAPVIVSIVSEVLNLCPPEDRQQTVDSLVKSLGDCIKVHCAMTFAEFDGLDPDIMASAERARIKDARGDTAADRG